jgi:hypothetical protein
MSHNVGFNFALIVVEIKNTPTIAQIESDDFQSYCTL